MRRADFGDDFTWGVASAAFQIEGAPDADGKRPSVWDDLGRKGRIAGGRVGDVAIDFYNRWESDLDLIQWLGVNANRFSISWPRVFGDGRGPWNDAGGAFYDRVIDGCLARGLEPWVTLYHWDTPSALQREGGWTRRGIVDDFAAFAEAVAQRYGDRVKHWMVFNEPLSVTGHIAAGLLDNRVPQPVKALRAVHHMNLACAEAGRRMREILPADADIGITQVVSVAHPYESTDERTNRARRAVEALLCDMFIDPAGGLGYPFDANPLLKAMRPAIEDGDLELAKFTYDFLGVQYYGPAPVKAFPIPGLRAIVLPWARGSQTKLRSEVGVPVDADGLLWSLRKYAKHPAARRLVVTENGFGMQDRLRDGRVRDDIRTWYLREHLQAVLDARAEGIPVDGFFEWSYADNVEWFLGTRARFGLFYVDYDNDLARVAKDSAYWFHRLLTDPDGAD
ncbi:MAG: family 1 glycosylhydrolase [Acidimicrobiia bacterium]|nr:family 1 glycosylhydrolase [Acidimicrobiia bacterium]